MDQSEKLTRVTAMSMARLSALRAAMMRDVALELLSAQGSVTAKEVHDTVQANFVPPSEEQLLVAVTQKARAAIEVQRKVRQAESARLAGLERKVEKYEELLRQTKQALAEYTSNADNELAEAIELLEFLEEQVA